MDPNPVPEQPIHSMSEADRQVALEVLTTAWSRFARSAPAGPPPTGGVIMAAVESAATVLPEFRVDVGGDYARFGAEAAVWYLDRAVRRVADPERNGWTAARRAENLDWFAGIASPDDLETVFAMAVALNVDDA